VGALNSYLTDTRQLLHDSSADYWSDQELTGYINKARRRVCQDSKCLRQYVTKVNLTTGQEAYTVQTIDPILGPYIIDIMNINVYLQNTRYPLIYLSLTEFNAKLRYWNNFLQQPAAYTRVGATTILIGPIPNQNYVSDWDCAINPPDLVSDSQTEAIPVPFTEPVMYWASYLAKYKEQSMSESAMFKAEYRSQMLMISRAWQTRIIPSSYA
jgi:hypothetical protein